MVVELPTAPEKGAVGERARSTPARLTRVASTTEMDRP
jgi:hypothetical protein